MQGTIAGLQNDKGALTARVGELETAQRDLTTTLDLFMAAPNRPNLAEGGCDSGGDCRAPEITAGADSSGTLPPLSGNTWSRSVALALCRYAVLALVCVCAV